MNAGLTLGGDTTDLPFRQLAQHLPVMCWISDAEGQIIWVNDAWVAYTGLSAEDIATRGLSELHDPDILPQVRARWAEAKAAGTTAEMVFPLRSRDGTFRPFLSHVIPVHDAEGRLVRWVGANTDISVQSEAQARAERIEATLRESEARLNIAVEAAGVGVWEWRLDTNEFVYSARAREICGFSPDGPVTYDMVREATHPDDFPSTSAQARRALDPNVRDNSPYEYRIVRGEEVRWVLAFGEAIFKTTEDGAQVADRYIGSLIDITERRRTEEAVRHSEQQLQFALRAGRMAAWRVDAAGRIAPNPELNKLIALPESARPTLDELEPHYLPGEMDRIRRLAEASRDRGERYFEVEYRFRRFDGEVRWFSARAETQVTVTGEPDGVIGVVLDITERKMDEDRLRLLAREVDHRANNLLAVVQSVVALSRADSRDELRTVIGGRVQALAHAHQLLSAARWIGADLRRLLAEEWAAFAGSDAGRLFAEGPSVELSPAAAQGMALVLHELTTNAAKHGALSTPAGSVRVAWTMAPDEVLRLEWLETGGPVVTRPPDRQGFGVTLLSRALGGALRGQVEMDWRPQGLSCRVTLPMTSPAMTSRP